MSVELSALVLSLVVATERVRRAEIEGCESTEQLERGEGVNMLERQWGEALQREYEGAIKAKQTAENERAEAQQALK